MSRAAYHCTALTSIYIITHVNRVKTKRRREERKLFTKDNENWVTYVATPSYLRVYAKLLMFLKDFSL